MNAAIRRTFGGDSAVNRSRWTAEMDGLTGIESDRVGMEWGYSTHVKEKIAGTIPIVINTHPVFRSIATVRPDGTGRPDLASRVKLL